MAQPWIRPAEKSTHPDLKAWVRERCAEILGALLTIGRYWFVKGTPAAGGDTPCWGPSKRGRRSWAASSRRLGSRGSLRTAPVSTSAQQRMSACGQRSWRVWYRNYGQEAKTAQAIVEALQTHETKPTFREALPDEFSLADENLSRKLGKAFAKREGVRYGTRRLFIKRSGRRSGSPLPIPRSARPRSSRALGRGPWVL
jgi:hypothetical protein